MEQISFFRCVFAHWYYYFPPCGRRLEDGDSSNRDGWFQGQHPASAQWWATADHGWVLELAGDSREDAPEHQDRHFHLQAQLADAIRTCVHNSALHF